MQMVPLRVKRPAWQPARSRLLDLWPEFLPADWPLLSKTRALGTKITKANSVQTIEVSRERGKPLPLVLYKGPYKWGGKEVRGAQGWG